MSESNILYCPVCLFELGEGSAIKNECPDCGSKLRCWDVSDGTRPGKRNGNVYRKAEPREYFCIVCGKKIGEMEHVEVVAPHQLKHLIPCER